ncbi:MAG: hypothetical protein K6G76_01895 [Lachnospiraceae bacterium]|nr:hypothetical protein [Lachnospiraceae bacterium]
MVFSIANICIQTTINSYGSAAMAVALVLTNIVNYIFIGAEHFFVGL